MKCLTVKALATNEKRRVGSGTQGHGLLPRAHSATPEDICALSPALLKRHRVPSLGSAGPPGCGLLVAHTPRWISRLRTFVLMMAGTPTSEEGPQWGTVSQEGTARWQGIQRGQEEAKLLLATSRLWPGRRTKPHCPCSQTAVLPSGQSSNSRRGPLLGPVFGQSDARGSKGLAWSPPSGATGT